MRRRDERMVMDCDLILMSVLHSNLVRSIFPHILIVLLAGYSLLLFLQSSESMDSGHKKQFPRFRSASPLPFESFTGKLFYTARGIAS